MFEQSTSRGKVDGGVLDHSAGNIDSHIQILENKLVEANVQIRNTHEQATDILAQSDEKVPHE